MTYTYPGASNQDQGDPLSSASKPHGFASADGRNAKADKIIAILIEACGPPADELSILDIGTGSGHISQRLADLGTVVTCDVIDQRVSGRDLPFVAVHTELPFRSSQFDLVVSNHVIEHVADPRRHLEEVRRVLRPGGVVYLATPNRLWPREPHTRLLGLHYLPAAWFSRLAIRLGRSHESIRLLSLFQLRRWTKGRFELTTWHDRVVVEPDRYNLTLPGWARRMTSLLPDGAISLLSPTLPTLICLLRPAAGEDPQGEMVVDG